MSYSYFLPDTFFPKEALAAETTKQDNDNKNTIYFSMELSFILSKNIN